MSDAQTAVEAMLTFREAFVIAVGDASPFAKQALAKADKALALLSPAPPAEQPGSAELTSADRYRFDSELLRGMAIERRAAPSPAPAEAAPDAEIVEQGARALLVSSFRRLFGDLPEWETALNEPLTEAIRDDVRAILAAILPKIRDAARAESLRENRLLGADTAAAYLEKHKARIEEAARAEAFDTAVSAAASARYGAPSNWAGAKPAGWHLPDPCSPRDASMHDNGCTDAMRAIRARGGV